MLANLHSKSTDIIFISSQEYIFSIFPLNKSNHETKIKTL